MFLPSRILDLAFLAIEEVSNVILKHLSLLTWCPVAEVQSYLQNKRAEMEEDYNNAQEREKWKSHPLYKEKRILLEKQCSDEGLDTRGMKHVLVRRIVQKKRLKEPDPINEFKGDMLEIPVSAREIAKLPLAKMKQMLKFYDVPTVRTKDQLVLRLVAVRAGTKHLLFQNEKEALLSLVDVISSSLIWKEKEQAIITDEIKYRTRTFKTQENASLYTPSRIHRSYRPRKSKSTGYRLP